MKRTLSRYSKALQPVAHTKKEIKSMAKACKNMAHYGTNLARYGKMMAHHGIFMAHHDTTKVTTVFQPRLLSITNILIEVVISDTKVSYAANK